MGGKVLRIAPEAPNTVLPGQWLAIRVDHAEELDRALKILEEEKNVLGIWLFPGMDMDLWARFRERYTFVAAAGGVVLDEQQRLLVIRRLGKWDLPKGKVDRGETVEKAALREVREECGLQHLELMRPFGLTWHIYPHKGRQMLKRTDWFLMRTSSSEELVPQTDEGITDIRWCGTEEVDELRGDTYPSLLTVIDAWVSGDFT